MKFLHLADLHLGKRVNGFDMLEDQRFILEQILTLCEKHGVEAVVIAGDIYDTPVPPAAACTLLDWFLTQLAAVIFPIINRNLIFLQKFYKADIILIHQLILTSAAHK